VLVTEPFTKHARDDERSGDTSRSEMASWNTGAEIPTPIAAMT